jgi:hypothetical protein
MILSVTLAKHVSSSSVTGYAIRIRGEKKGHRLEGKVGMEDTTPVSWANATNDSVFAEW